MKIYESKNILVKDCIAKIRNKNTDSYNFQKNIKRVTQILAAEASNLFSTKTIDIESPIAPCSVNILEKGITIIPILRAGLAMSEALRDLYDDSSVGHIGLYRDENTLESIKYYEKMPANIKDNNIIVCDPLIATGNSLISALKILEKYKNKNIFIIGIIASKQALKILENQYPDIPIFIGEIDEKLNDHGYIIPGVGDAGDRIFKTK